MDVGRRELIPVDELQLEFSATATVGFFTGNLPVAVGEVKVVENAIVVGVEFGFFDVKKLEVGGGGGGEDEEMEKEEEGEGYFGKHDFLAAENGTFGVGVLVYLRDRRKQDPGIYLVLHLGRKNIY